MNELILQVNKLYEDRELLKRLLVLPEYKADVQNKGERLVSLLDVYKIFIPTQTTLRIYNQLYLSLISSLEKKETLSEVALINDNFRAMRGGKRYGIIGGLESFKITGSAGMGKTSSVQRCIDVISEDKLIEAKNGRMIIPILMIECVADGSFKSLLISILQQVDYRLGTSYLSKNNHPTITVDILLNAVSNVLINHVAVLVIDEIERVANDSRRGETLINYLTQLVNQSNISICFVGNECSNSFFQNKEYMSRRTLGLSINKMNYDENFYQFLELVFRYQYTNKKVELNGEFSRLFYRYSNGIPSMVISLFAEVQKWVIISGAEMMTIDSINEVFNTYFSNMNTYIETPAARHSQELQNKPDLSFLVETSKKSYVFEKARLESNMETVPMIEKLSKILNIEYVHL